MNYISVAIDKYYFIDYNQSTSFKKNVESAYRN